MTSPFCQSYNKAQCIIMPYCRQHAFFSDKKNEKILRIYQGKTAFFKHFRYIHYIAKFDKCKAERAKKYVTIKNFKKKFDFYR